jgi:hypothetical protein
MAWAEKQLKRNAFNEIVPQYYDEALDDWVPYTGVYGEVTLSGKKREDVVVIERAVRTASPAATTALTVPEGAVGVHINGRVYGSTGTFASGEGLKVYIAPRGFGGLSGAYGVVHSPVITSSEVSVQWAPSAAQPEAGTLPRLMVVGAMLPIAFGLNFEISGTFEAGQGIDCELQVRWIYG